MRVHMIEDHLPSLEGILVRNGREMLLAVAEVTLAADAQAHRFESRLVAVPRERIAFFEVL